MELRCGEAAAGRLRLQQGRAESESARERQEFVPRVEAACGIQSAALRPAASAMRHVPLVVRERVNGFGAARAGGGEVADGVGALGGGLARHALRDALHARPVLRGRVEGGAQRKRHNRIA